MDELSAEAAERPLAWQAILEDTPVNDAKGVRIGTIGEVLGSEDIFHGIAVDRGRAGDPIFVPAEHVASITNHRIDLDLDAPEITQLPVYEPEASFHLGFVGWLGRKLGWVEESDRAP